jgi:flagellar biosynthesis protein FlhF
MKIIRHTARDMRQALRGVREQLGEDAVILSSRRTGEGVEVTAAIDFDASTLEAGGFAAPSAPPAAPAKIIDATPVAAPTRTTAGPARPAAALSPTALALTTARAGRANKIEPAATFQQVVSGAAQSVAPNPEPAPSYDELASLARLPTVQPGYDADWISDAAREAVAEHVAGPRAPVLAPAAQAAVAARTAPVARAAAAPPAPASYSTLAADDPVAEVREATLTPLASSEVAATFAEFRAPAAAAPAATEAMGNELKTLRRMLETQLAHLAWNDLTRRAPVHTEILRELTEIGITQDLAEHLVRQLPEDTELTFARRFAIAGLSQYLKVTGDHWLDDGGRVAFAGATGVGKTTTLAKIAVRWVLRHGPRDIALVAADSVRLGAQDQLQSFAQLLGVSVYTPEKFDQLPSLLARLHERLILIDTPGSSVRDPQLAGRLAVLSNSASKLETALVLAASTQAGAIEEAVKHFAPANPSCCVLTKLDEAASLGGVLSVLVRARLPVSYMSEGQRVPEDLRPARALELVSAAVRLAKARGAAADEDLLRRRFGKNAHGIS